MSGYSSAAYLQRHRGEHPLPPIGDRVLCPCQCGRILSRGWFKAIFGCEPEDYPYPVESPLRWAR